MTRKNNSTLELDIHDLVTKEEFDSVGEDRSVYVEELEYGGDAIKEENQ